jgi:hypothetical protein
LREGLGTDEGTGRTHGERLAEALVTAAIGGDVRATTLVFDRVDGRAPVTADAGGLEDDLETIRDYLDPARFRSQEGAWHDRENEKRL